MPDGEELMCLTAGKQVTEIRMPTTPVGGEAHEPDGEDAEEDDTDKRV